jgi:hypothetical protein
MRSRGRRADGGRDRQGDDGGRGAGGRLPDGVCATARARTCRWARSSPASRTAPEAAGRRSPTRRRPANLREAADAAARGAAVIMPASSAWRRTPGLIVAWMKSPGDEVAADDVLLRGRDRQEHDGGRGRPRGLARRDARRGGRGGAGGRPRRDRPKDRQRRPAKPAAAAPAPKTPGANGGRILASPKARRLALEQGLDLNRLAEAGHPQPFHVADLEVLRKMPAPHPPARPPKRRAA